MKLLIIGSRSIKSFDFSEHVFEGVDTVISGGASGIDSLAERYADEHRLSKYIIRPRYDLYGRAAPLVRNKAMVEMCDAILAIWDGKSRGTLSTVEYAKKLHKEVRLITPSSLDKPTPI